MKLEKIQLMSLITKGLTMTLGILQSIIVIRVLSPAQFGLVGLTMSIGGVIGVSQHLGVVDGAIREIAVLKKKSEVGKVFWVSHLVRQLVTIPLSVALLMLAGFIANNIYGRPEITTYLQIFAAALVLQGWQDVHGATLTGMKKFIPLYLVQILTAAINIMVFGYLTWRYNVAGFFWAIIITTTIMVLMYAIIILRQLAGHLALPSITDIKKYALKVMRIGAFMYLARIFFIVWQRLPILFLGGVLPADELGYLNVSQTFGSKLTIIAMALSEVNLSWMSSLYSRQKKEFTHVVTKNMHRVLMLMMLLTVVLLFFTPEILTYLIGNEYLPAHKLILLMTLAFFLYALTDIGTSSVFVPANAPKFRTYVYGVMTLTSGIVITVLFFTRPDVLLATWAVLGGAAVAYIAMIIISSLKFHVPILTKQLTLFLLMLIASVWWLFTEPPLIWRITVFSWLVIFILREAFHRYPLPSKWSKRPLKNTTSKASLTAARGGQVKFICFAGAEFNLPTWTNRQHIMSRLSKRYPVLYIEPRVWIAKYVWLNLLHPRQIYHFIKRIFIPTSYQQDGLCLYVKAQFNLIPGSREIEAIANFNHFLNKYLLRNLVKKLHFDQGRRVVWLYDTEAAQYLPMCKDTTVLYDCVDNHAAQAGVNRNPTRVKMEEDAILQRADIVTVTSHRLLTAKKKANQHVYLVLNAGDVDLYAKRPRLIPPRLASLSSPIIGTVGALDEYKIDFDLLRTAAQKKPNWNFVFIGKPMVDQKSAQLKKLSRLKNVHLLGQIERHQVPNYVYQFDVCIIPYHASRYNEASFPLKFWEFMATGQPIVVTGLPELKKYKHLIGYAERQNDLVRQIKLRLKPNRAKAQARIKAANSHSWEKRLNKILKLLNNHYH